MQFVDFVEKNNVFFSIETGIAGTGGKKAPAILFNSPVLP